MTIKYEINKVRKTVTVIGSDIVTADEILSHLDKLGDDIDYKAPMKKLIDWRAIESISISSKEAEIIVQRKKDLEARFSDERCAFVVAYGTARVFKTLVDGAGFSTQVFRNIKDAMDWLYHHEGVVIKKPVGK